MHPVSLPVQTLYAQLLSLVGPSGLRGSFYSRKVGNQRYLYLKSSGHDGRLDVFLGRENDETTLEKRTAIEVANSSYDQRRELVSLLVKAGLPQPPNIHAQVIAAFENAGLLDHVVIIGTMAYVSYSALVGSFLPHAALTTQDTDIAVATLTLKSATGEKTLLSILQKADPSFRGVPQLVHGAWPSQFRTKTSYGVDIVTPQRRRTDRNPMQLKSLTAGAAPLQHLDWLIADPVEALVLRKAGWKIHVPQPARYAVHKLIVAHKRTHDRIKRQKDLMQAASLIGALRETDASALEEAIDSAKAKGKKGWAEPIAASLEDLERFT